MKNLFLFAGILSTGMLVSCGNAADGDANSEDSVTTETTMETTSEGTQVGQANLMSTSDTTQNIGTAKFYRLDDGQIRLDLEINAASRADSNVAVHFHEHGDCGNKGDNTHGHWNPTNQQHGEWGSASFHIGDIGNLQLDANGHATKTLTTNLWSVDDTASNNIIGKALIVHGGTDDYVSQPSGNAGPRIGCGVVTGL